ncbi:MAG: transporter [Microbacterium sp.]|jgi:ABC-2 type transport system ATP-binding protein|uniref:ABC transporter ATP-binding protein n=1 Tax=Microbacterium sp. AG238 TaxID=2183994 RepID=UPI000E7604F5|nr:ABC transporter ATP-binding protein [Microbacterium sp. AG238]MDF2916152.1 transporter [Microbacterium sp.]RKE60113.1 ABC-2 type transport system ATP-binding protein [Microbacterium sp. AG238]
MVSIEPPEVVRVENVSKTFVVRKDNSLKDRVIGFRRHRKHRRDYTAVDGVSLSIRAGTTVGLLGANGSGKSTLLKMIGGILTPDTGEVFTRGRLAALLELGAGFHPELSGRENVYLNAAILGLSRAETDERYDEIVRFSGIGEFIDNEVKFYSSGMYMRLAFAVAVHTDPDILLVDEVLAVGDEAFQRKCMDKIRSFQKEGRTIILVSHSAGQIAELCDTAFVLKDGEVVHAGDVREGLSAMRDIMEGKRIGESAEAERAARQQPVRAQSLTVTKIETLDASGRVATTFHPGDAMILRIHVNAAEGAEQWTTGFSIDNSSGQMVIASNTERLDATLPPISAGDHFMDYRIGALHLGPGEFFINANTSPTIDVDTHVLWQGARFRMTGGEGNLGVVEAAIAVENDTSRP